MSKKQAKSEQRDVDLPDWADEVTPSDEVMRKFYAPTGSFRSGPISVQEPPPPTPSPYIPKVEEGVGEPGETHAEPQTLPEPAPPEPAATIDLTPGDEKEKQPEVDSLPPSKPEAARRSQRKSAAAHESSREAGPVAFDEFVRRWSNYLYTGQLAVMRELYNLTIARGTTDCFTRYSELAAATKMTRRNCIKVVNFLVDRGFIERLEVCNDATGKGIKLRVHLLSHP